jgi:hypothetical protein
MCINIWFHCFKLKWLLRIHSILHIIINIASLFYHAKWCFQIKSIKYYKEIRKFLFYLRNIYISINYKVIFRRGIHKWSNLFIDGQWQNAHDAGEFFVLNLRYLGHTKIKWNSVSTFLILHDLHRSSSRALFS